jgi:hypothetical protein
MLVPLHEQAVIVAELGSGLLMLLAKLHALVEFLNGAAV